VVARPTLALYLGSLALLPWSWFPPFPWLHEHAQWSDAVFALTTVLWAFDRCRAKQWPSLRPLHAALAAYLAAAVLSFIIADPRPPAGLSKLLGIAELVALSVVTSDLAARGRMTAAMARVTAATMLATALAALAGQALFLIGTPTPLIGSYGDLLPGAYARSQAGLGHPNLLASYCVFAWGVVARGSGSLGPRVRRVTFAALLVTAGLTFSRGILALLLALLVGRATTPGRRWLALGFALVAAALIAALSVWNVALEPTRPLDARIEAGASSRGRALASSFETLMAHPWMGAGSGRSPGSKDGIPFDAHLTPLNVAATLGLPALLAFLAIPWLLWRERRRPTDLALWGALAGMGLDALAQDVETSVSSGCCSAWPTPNVASLW
jgi:hypothetical protein